MKNLKFRATTEQEREVFGYLNDLRLTGIVNMFGATPYMMSEFGISRGEAAKLLSLWMKNFSEEANYDEISVE